jgi:hypothetical protein
MLGIQRDSSRAASVPVCQAEMQEVAEEIETQEAVPKNAQYRHHNYTGATAEENSDAGRGTSCPSCPALRA